MKEGRDNKEGISKYILEFTLPVSSQQHKTHKAQFLNLYC